MSHPRSREGNDTRPLPSGRLDDGVARYLGIGRSIPCRSARAGQWSRIRSIPRAGAAAASPSRSRCTVEVTSCPVQEPSTTTLSAARTPWPAGSTKSGLISASMRRSPSCAVIRENATIGERRHAVPSQQGARFGRVRADVGDHGLVGERQAVLDGACHELGHGESRGADDDRQCIVGRACEQRLDRTAQELGLQAGQRHVDRDGTSRDCAPTRCRARSLSSRHRRRGSR